MRRIASIILAATFALMPGTALAMPPCEPDEGVMRSDAGETCFGWGYSGDEMPYNPDLVGGDEGMPHVLIETPELPDELPRTA